MKLKPILLTLILLAAPSAHAATQVEETGAGGTKVVKHRGVGTAGADGLSFDGSGDGIADVIIDSSGNFTVSGNSARLTSTTNTNEFIDFNDAPIDDMILISGGVEFLGQRTFYPKCGEDLDALIQTLSSGDTIILPPCTFTITGDIDIDRSLTIIGASPTSTIISLTTTTATNVFDITADNTTLRNIGIRVSATGAVTIAAIRASATTTTVFQNIRVENVVVNMETTGIDLCLQALDVGGVIDNLTCNLDSSSDDGRGIYINPASTMETETHWLIRDAKIFTSGGAGTGDDSWPIQCAEATATKNTFVSVINSNLRSVGATSTGTSYALASSGENCIVTAENSVLNGSEGDAAQLSSGTLILRNSVLVNNSTTGTVINEGINTSAGYTTSGTVVSSRATDIGWSVVAGADTACNTTCTFACVFGVNTGSANADIVDCADATADECLCAGAN